LQGKARPDYKSCVAISTNSALKEMIAPAILVIASPIVVGVVFGVEALAGVLAGSMISGIVMALSTSNSGGGWDNAKKYIEKHEGKGTDKHKAAVVGDTVGDPFKDTSGPSLNILMKLMAIISLVFVPFFQSAHSWLMGVLGMGN
jgi:K(+)-stimulated pyrophosphate-energized sodium pump